MDRRSPAGLRQIVARIPGARRLHEALWQSPGTWLYRRPTLSWLGEEELVRQLPRPYRFFARYCAAQRFAPLGAETLLRAIIALRRDRGTDGIVPLRLGGSIAHLDLTDPRFLRIPVELAQLPRLLAPFVAAGDTFVDVGANHGAFSIAAAKLVGADGRVIAIEPQPRLAEAVRRSLDHGGARFEVHQLACGDRSTEVDFYVPTATSGSAGVFSTFSAVSRHRKIRVAMRRLDDLLAGRTLPGRVLIKLDVEGSETSFLAGAASLIRSKSPRILIEMNTAAMRAAGTSRAGLVGTLRQLGYDRYVTLDQPSTERPLVEESAESDLLVLPALTGAG